MLPGREYHSSWYVDEDDSEIHAERSGIVREDDGGEAEVDRGKQHKVDTMVASGVADEGRDAAVGGQAVAGEAVAGVAMVVVIRLIVAVVFVVVFVVAAIAVVVGIEADDGICHCGFEAVGEVEEGWRRRLHDVCRCQFGVARGSFCTLVDALI